MAGDEGMSRINKMKIFSIIILLMLSISCGPGRESSGPPGVEQPTPTANVPAQEQTPVGFDISKVTPETKPTPIVRGAWKDYDGPTVTISVWMYPQDEDSLKAYKDAFEEKHPNIKIKYVVYPEDNYQTKINTALQAHKPPDVAVMENKAWMKAGKVVDLTPYYKQWGIFVNDFAQGGVARFTLEKGPSQGIFGVGDFLGGNIIVYNKDMFDEARVSYPPADKSLTWPQYAEICKKVAKPDPNPTKRIYGCSVPPWGFGIWQKWLFGPNGKRALGNMNSPEMIEAWNVGTELVREKYAPSGNVLQTLPNGEPDLFTQKRIAMTWTDFTFVKDYKAAGIDFGIAPWPVIRGSESFVDTWTAPWGTFTESEHQHAALTFLKFMATDAQRIRGTVSADPPLSFKVAEQMKWGQGDPLKEQYLQVLKVAAKAQPFVPPLPEGGYNPDDIYNKMTVQGVKDAKPLLDDAAKRTQPLLDKAWQEWEKIGR